MNSGNADTGNSTAAAKPDSKKPNRWWHWILIYPTLAVAIISSIPTYYELFQSRGYDVPFGKSKMAKKQNDLWEKNLECTYAPPEWYVTDYNIKVDATICKSGDVLVKIFKPDGESRYSWVPVEGLISGRAALSPFSEAYARQPANDLLMSQMAGIVLCQRFIAEGRLLRRIQFTTGCMDEIINTYNGQVLQRIPAPCNPNC